jgi:hypothetical protein
MSCDKVRREEWNIMAGGGWLGWRFKRGTPAWFTGIVGLLLVDSVVHFGLLMTVSSWAQSTRDAMHTYRVPFRDGVNYFVDPWLGRYLDSWWIGVGLFAVLVVLLYLKRDRLERGSNSL